MAAGLSKDQQKEFKAKAKERFEKYLSKMISRKNVELLADLKIDSVHYQLKAKALFETLKYIQEFMEKRGRNTEAIRQAMVDLIGTVGYGNQATQALLKSKNALDNVEGLKRTLDERDAVAMDLGYVGHFKELQTSLKVDFPTGFSKNENVSLKLNDLEKEVLASNFVPEAAVTTRVRSLSIQEAPFRSCLGGSDCSTRTYFSKALDPNFNYFTMTDSQNHSSGHVTVVLGEARDTKGKRLRVAFIDKLQNVPNALIKDFLNAVAMSLQEKGYQLAMPASVGDHNGLSNMDTTRHYVQQEILPLLQVQLKTFTPHAHQYSFENAYSRAYEQLDVKVWQNIAVSSDAQIVPGIQHRSYMSPVIEKQKLADDFFKLKESNKPEDTLKFISSGSVVSRLETLGIYSKKEFLQIGRAHV